MVKINSYYYTVNIWLVRLEYHDQLVLLKDIT